MAPNTNPFLYSESSVQKKKIKLKPRRIDFSAESSVLSPGLGLVEPSVPNVGLSPGDQGYLRPVPQPGVQGTTRVSEEILAVQPFFLNSISSQNIVSQSTVPLQSTPNRNQFQPETAGGFARSEPVRVPLTANSVRGSFAKSLGRQHQVTQVI